MKALPKFAAQLLLIPIFGIALSCREKTATENVTAKPPNILFCIADDASFPYMGAYGTEWVQTPAFDRVAKEGLLFTNAYTPNAKCAPSRACILTGRNSWQLEAAANHWAHFPDKYKTFMEELGDKGYLVGHTQKGWGPGTVGEINGVKRLLTGKAWNDRKLTPPAQGISNIDYAGNFEAFLEQRPEGQPFCFWYGSIEPHRDYEFGVSLRNGRSTKEITKVPPYWPDNDTVRTDMLDYAYELNYFDQHLDKMLKMLEARGELDNTIVVITSDHGMPFPRAKGQAYDVSNHVPLAIMWKAGIRKPGRTIEDLISFIDLAPTFLDVARVPGDSIKMQPMQGRTMMDIFLSEKTGIIDSRRDHVLIGKERHDVGRPGDAGYPIRGIVTHEYLYLKNYETGRWPAGNPETGYLNTDGSPTKTNILNLRRTGVNDTYWQLSFGKRIAEELYDLRNDRDCMRNLALSSEHKQTIAQLSAKMEEELRRQEDPRMFGNGYIFDQYPYADPSGIGFYERFMRGEKVNHGWVNDSDFEKKPM